MDQRDPSEINAVQDTELWSTIDLRLDWSLPNVNHEWFSYSMGMQVANNVRMATRADTNVPRDGRNGLPSGWHFTVRGWRARAIAPRALLREDTWWAWCAATSVFFEVGWRRVATWTLDELIRAPLVRDGRDGLGRFDPPFEVAAQVQYKVSLAPDHPCLDWPRLQMLAITADPSNAVQPVERWTPIKLRCYLRGHLTTTGV